MLRKTNWLRRWPFKPEKRVRAPHGMEYLFCAKTTMDALNKISKYLDSKKTKHYYFRFWDVVFEDGEYVKVDYGSHVDFFFIRTGN